jgi:hypothetical protein
MKAYVMTTGVIFALITIAHIMRIVAEPRAATEPFFIFLTVLSAGLSAWGFFVLRRLNR